MIKRVITIVLSLCLLFSISVMAQGISGDMPQGMPEMRGERPAGNRGGMGMPPNAEMPEGFAPPSMQNGKMPEGFTPPEGFQPPQNADNFAPRQNGAADNKVSATTPPADSGDNTQTPENAEKTNQMQGGMQFGGEMPEEMKEFFANMQGGNMNAQEEQETGIIGFVKEYSTPVTSIILLIFAYIFVIFYKRKHY